MVFNTEVDVYVTCKSMLEQNTHKVYSLVLGKRTEMLKIKINHSKVGSKASTRFDVLKLINITKSIIFKFEDHKYLPLSLHQ